jgi:hypothetical protein
MAGRVAFPRISNLTDISPSIILWPAFAAPRLFRHFVIENILGGITMTDTTVTTADDFGDPDPVDLDRRTASLDHLRAHCTENDAAPSPSDVCERLALTRDGDPYLGDIDQPVNSLYFALPRVAA